MTIREKAEAFCKELSDDGFNGIDFYEAKIGTTRERAVEDMLSDGRTKEEAEAWADDYVCINLGADLPEVDGPYCSFDCDEFEGDLRKHMIETFGTENLYKKEENHFWIDLYGGDIEVYNREEYEQRWRDTFR